jgi:hypothetical protein
MAAREIMSGGAECVGENESLEQTGALVEAISAAP